MAKRWAEIGAALGERASDSQRRRAPLARLSGSHREEPRRRRAFLLANGRGGNVDAASPLAREPFIAVAELTGSAAQGRILLAAPIALAEIEARFADRIESRDEVTFDAASASLRARSVAQAWRHRARRTDPRGRTGRRDRAHAGARASRASASTSCRGQSADTMARPRHVPAPGRRRANGPTFPTRRSPPAPTNGWLPPFEGKTALSRSRRRTNLQCAVTDLLPWNLRRRLDAEAPTHFDAPTGTQAAIDYDAEAGPDDLDPRAGIVRPRTASLDRRRPRAAGDRTAVARAPAGAGDARLARLLARLLAAVRTEMKAVTRAIPGRTIRSPRCRRGAPSRAGHKFRLTCESPCFEK